MTIIRCTCVHTSSELHFFVILLLSNSVLRYFVLMYMYSLHIDMWRWTRDAWLNSMTSEWMANYDCSNFATLCTTYCQSSLIAFDTLFISSHLICHGIMSWCTYRCSYTCTYTHHPSCHRGTQAVDWSWWAITCVIVVCTSNRSALVAWWERLLSPRRQHSTCRRSNSHLILICHRWKQADDWSRWATTRTHILVWGTLIGWLWRALWGWRSSAGENWYVSS